MRLKNADRESLREAMPGDVITVAGAGRDEVFSLAWTDGGEWVLVRGTVAARAPDRVTERIMELLRGDAATITDRLDRLGAEFPLPEQVSGATDFPTPRDIFWRRCLDRLPGEHLEGPEYARRVAFSLVRARAGWKILCMEEADEDRLEYGDYLSAVQTDEEPDIRVLRSWRGRSIGNRDGILSEDAIRPALRSIGVDPDTVSALPDEDEPEEDRWVWNDEARELVEWFAARENERETRPLPVEVIGLESPVQERIGRSRSTR